jgi:capsular polysaccharide biosynthesis protein
MVEIEEMKSEIEGLKIKKQSRKYQVNSTRPISIYSIKVKKKPNIILAFVIGSMFSIIIAFFIEYLRIMRTHPKPSPTPV